MSREYNTGGQEGNMMYDDSAFQLFLVALLAVYWIPTALYRTVRFIRRAVHVKTPIEEAKEEWCTCAPCQDVAQTFLTKKKGARSIRVSDIIFVTVTILLAILSVKVYRSTLVAEAPFDPFTILGVEEDATSKQIKQAYRKQSRLHHPDKNPGDENAQERFIAVGKAYAALTDETSKANYIKYGNPDGYLGTTLGLGLPEWVAEKKNAVLFSYFVFIVLVFPLMVGIWWRKRSQQLTSQIMTSTFMLYRETLQQTAKFRDLLAAFCGSHEFRDLYSPENDDAVKQIADALRRSGKVDLKKTKSVVPPEPYQVQNYHIMCAYLARIPIPKQLHHATREILKRSESLLTAMTDTVGAFQRPDCQAAWEKTFMHGHTIYLATCVSMTQCIIQALDEKGSPFLQIPHFTEREVKQCMSSRSPSVRSIYDLMKLDMDEQRKILKGFTEHQYLDMKAFLDRFPSAMLEVSDPAVEGEEDPTVHAGDTVTIRTKLTIMRRSGSAFSPCTPYMPFKKQEAWWLWLADDRLKVPLEVKRLLPKMARGHDPGMRKKSKGGGCCGVHDGGDEEELVPEKLSTDPRVTIFELKFTFIAPRAGDYNLEVTTACDTYKGASKSKQIKMKVLKAVEPPEDCGVKYFDTDDESSEEEESTEDEEENSEGEYEYIEVTDSESEAGDFEDENDDQYGISSGPSGDPSK